MTAAQFSPAAPSGAPRSSPNATGLEVAVHSVAFAAAEVRLLDLRSVDGSRLPGFTAGAHIDVHLTDQLVRSYSLVGLPACSAERYLVAVARTPNSRGGSRYVHERVRPDDRLWISLPRNTFQLVEDASHSVFIAGGIGITPIYGMLRRLDEVHASWELHYAVRHQSQIVFRRELETLASVRAPRVNVYIGNTIGPRPMDVHALIARSPPDAHIYCCGPSPMLEEFESATIERPSELAHCELFQNRLERPTGRAFEVVLARTGGAVVVESGKSILDALLDAGIDVPFSCMEGICGSCRTRVISGVPDHRDSVLTAAERAVNDSMLVCCSGAKEGRLVLDL